MPALGVYFVWPSRAARAAASTMCGGVGKPGSPTSRWIASGRRQASSMTSRIAWWGRPVARAEISVVRVVMFARDSLGNRRSAVPPRIAASSAALASGSACSGRDSMVAYPGTASIHG